VEKWPIIIIIMLVIVSSASRSFGAFGVEKVAKRETGIGIGSEKEDENGNENLK